MNLRHDLLLGLLVTTIAVSACSSAIPLAQTPVGKPQLLVGDRWTMRTIDLWKYEVAERYEQHVVSVEGDTVALERKPPQSQDARVITAGKELIDGESWVLLDENVIAGKVVVLAFPLYIGKTWQYDYQTVDVNGTKAQQSRTAKVEAWEEVVVLAGTFKALKVTVDGRWRASMRDGVFTGKADETLWYAPEAKRWVKRELILRAPEGRIVEQTSSELIRADLQK